jgi:hypothetical protein
VRSNISLHEPAETRTGNLTAELRIILTFNLLNSRPYLARSEGLRSNSTKEKERRCPCEPPF